MRFILQRGNDASALNNVACSPAREEREAPKQHSLTRGALIGTIVLSVLLACGMVAHDYAKWQSAERETLSHNAEHVRQSTEAYFERYESLLRRVSR